MSRSISICPLHRFKDINAIFYAVLNTVITLYKFAMSFGWSASDVAALAQLAWRTVQNARKACGEYDELTREVFSLHIVLRRLENTAKQPDSALNRRGDTSGEEIEAIASGCRSILHTLDKVLEKFNSLSEKQRSGRKLVARIRFGNGEMGDLADLRAKITYYTSVLSLYLNMVAAGSMGKIEKQMEEAGGDLKELKVAVTSITAKLMAGSNKEGSILTSYADDDKAVWREFRRELVTGGFSSSLLKKHKVIIKAYLEELGRRGILDEENSPDNALHGSSPNFDAGNGPTRTLPQNSTSGRPSHDGSSTSKFSPDVLAQPLHSSQPKDPILPASSGQDSTRLHENDILKSSKVDHLCDEVEGRRMCSETPYMDTLRESGMSSEQIAWSGRREQAIFLQRIYPKSNPQRRRPEITFVAKPWGICIIYCYRDVSTLLADFEYRTQILSFELRGPRDCRRLISTAGDPNSHERIRASFFERAVALVVKMQCVVYFESPESRGAVLQSYWFSRTPDIEQAGSVCTWFLSRAFDLYFRSQVLSIISDIHEWIVNFDTTWGRVTSLSDMNPVPSPITLRTGKPYFQPSPLYDWGWPGSVATHDWEKWLEEFLEIHLAILDESSHLYREYGVEVEQPLRLREDLRESFSSRLLVLNSRRHDESNLAELSKELGNLLLEYCWELFG